MKDLYRRHFQPPRISAKHSAILKKRYLRIQLKEGFPLKVVLKKSENKGAPYFTALMPWFQIQTLTQTLILIPTNTPHQTITLTRSKALTRPKNETFFPFRRELVMWSPKSKSSFSLITPQGCIFTLHHPGDLKSASKNTSTPVFKHQKYSNLTNPWQVN